MKARRFSYDTKESANVYADYLIDERLHCEGTWNPDYHDGEEWKELSKEEALSSVYEDIQVLDQDWESFLETLSDALVKLNDKGYYCKVTDAKIVNFLHIKYLYSAKTVLTALFGRTHDLSVDVEVLSDRLEINYWSDNRAESSHKMFTLYAGKEETWKN